MEGKEKEKLEKYKEFKRREVTWLGSVNVTVPNVVMGWRFE